MKKIRLYQPGPLAIQQEIELVDAAVQHAHVLKLKANQRLVIFNGEGGEFHGQITNISHKSCHVLLQEYVELETESPLKIHLVQGISRGQKMDYTIQKSVELGVTSIQPVLCHRSVVKLDGDKSRKKQQHWQAVAVSACEQCGRNRIPLVHEPQELSAWAHQNDAQGRGLILLPGGENKISSMDAQSEYTLVIGPEGGFEEHEAEWLLNNQYQSVSLGPRILRTETAALTAIAALNTLYGDL